MFVKNILRSKIRNQAVFGSLKSIGRYSSAAVSSPRSLVSETVDIDGTKLHYMRGGSGNHAVLLLPGGLGSAMTDFRPQLENLNKDVFTVVGWDPPGYGKSFPPERNWDGHFLEKDAVFAAKLMEKVGFSSYSLLGWSDGGISALILAAMFPQNVRKLVSLAANSYVVEEDVKIYNSIGDIDKWSPKMRQPFLELYGEQYFRKLWTGWINAFVGRFWEENKGDVCKSSLPKITAPTLIVQGKKDPLIPTFHAEYLHEHIKGSRLHIMPEGKHNPHLRYPKEFNSLVESFLMEPVESKI